MPIENNHYEISKMSKVELELYQKFFLKTWVERFQKYAFKPALLGAVFPENLVTCYDRDLYEQGYSAYNTRRIYENFSLFNKEYRVYLDVCIELGSPLYPSREYFVEHLNTYGCKGILNLRHALGDEMKIVKDGKMHSLTKLSSIVGGSVNETDLESLITKHYVDGKATYYKGISHDIEGLDGASPLLVMDANAISEERFRHVFCPKRAKENIVSGEVNHFEHISLLDDLITFSSDWGERATNVSKMVRYGARNKEVSTLERRLSKAGVFLIEEPSNGGEPHVLKLLSLDDDTCPILSQLSDNMERLTSDGEEYSVTEVFVQSCNFQRIHVKKVDELVHE
ncbi:hypothetical protein [Vibrio sp. D431a]|uniref:hypothetical protein n=1 Tax=Vibrio sp. D431a TaxID=2837388 RepID=UPI00255768C9|nr:hypothetical protein [Vibrio sp. D431a]MDK9789917.1 hypothetical protein [Vibrio sp. D431a]